MRAVRVAPLRCPSRLSGWALTALAVLAGVGGAAAARAEDGYDLWLRYPAPTGERLQEYRAAATQLVAPDASATLRVARGELERALGRMLGAVPPGAPAVTQDGAILLGTPRSLALPAALRHGLEHAGSEGYVIRTARVSGHRAIIVTANTDFGVLYGTFHFLRLLQTRQGLDALDIVSWPHVQHRVLDHWDNLDGIVERGYAGSSLWDWQKLPGYLDPRYTDYARACASIGINGAVLTNVNARAVVLTPLYLRKAAALAAVFRPYGIKIYLAARFSAPVEIGGLATADPLNERVRTWWRAKGGTSSCCCWRTWTAIPRPARRIPWSWQNPWRTGSTRL